MNDFSDLKNHSYRLYLRFIKPHTSTGSLVPTLEEEDDVKAFCVLIHAAIEEYVERLTEKTLVNSNNKFKSQKLIKSIPKSQTELDELNNNLIQLFNTLLLSNAYTIFSSNTSSTLKSHKAKLETASGVNKPGQLLNLTDVTNLTKKSLSYTNELLKESKVFFNKYVSENHGASLKYLMRLLIPVGIDIPNDLSMLNSLQKLAEYRGAYAHSKGLTVITSASDIAIYTIDAIQLCKRIDDSIRNFLDYTLA